MAKRADYVTSNVIAESSAAEIEGRTTYEEYCKTLQMDRFNGTALSNLCAWTVASGKDGNRVLMQQIIDKCKRGEVIWRPPA